LRGGKGRVRAPVAERQLVALLQLRLCRVELDDLLAQAISKPSSHEHTVTPIGGVRRRPLEAEQDRLGAGGKLVQLVPCLLRSSVARISPKYSRSYSIFVTLLNHGPGARARKIR
jgi:hypothetical protein